MSHNLRFTLDGHKKLPFLLSVAQMQHNSVVLPLKDEKNFYYGSRTIWESDSTRLYLLLDTPHIVLLNTAPLYLTQLEEGIRIQVKDANPVDVYWDWELKQRVRKIRLFPTGHYEQEKLPLGKKTRMPFSLNTVTIKLPTISVYLRFERNWEAEVPQSS